MARTTKQDEERLATPPAAEVEGAGMVPAGDPAADPALALYVTPTAQPPSEFVALTAGDRIDRLTLAQGQMQEILDRKAQPGDFLLGADRLNVGPTFDAWVAAWRPHAVHLEGDEAVSESYDPKSEAFQSIVKRSMTEERVEGVRFLFGPDFLFRLPQGWGTLMFASTARQRGNVVLGRLGKGVRIGSETKSSKRYTWLVPTVAAAEVEAPAADEVALARQVFLAVLAPGAGF